MTLDEILSLMTSTGIPHYHLKRGHINADSGDTTAGNVQRIVFKVSHAIVIDFLGFYGPDQFYAEADRKFSYLFGYTLLELTKRKSIFYGLLKIGKAPMTVIQKGSGDYKVKAKAKGYVQAKMHIPANKKIELLYYIQGPPTNCIKDPITTACIQTATALVRFDFLENCRVMPDFFFYVAEGEAEVDEEEESV